MMHKNASVDPHNFAMIPRADIPRSKFRIDTAVKTSFDGSFIYPFFVDEILPGDSYNLRMTSFIRLATPTTPVMDNLRFETFYFFVPNRLVWSNWEKFQGEQVNPGDSISYVIPQIVSPVAGYPALSIYDYLGLPTVGQVTAGQTVTHSALPLRAYNLIWNEWFRDENLQNSQNVPLTDGPDNQNLYILLRRGKRPDYFTSALPWPQKGAAVVTPLGTSAPIKSDGTIPLVRAFSGGGIQPDLNRHRRSWDSVPAPGSNDSSSTGILRTIRHINDGTICRPISGYSRNH
jgi:hypothetical protein